MTNPHKRICKVCGASYSYCPQCKEDFYKPTWYFMFCSQKCKDVFEILSACEVGNLSFEETKKSLNKIITTDDLERFDPFMAEQIRDILTYKENSGTETTTDKKQKKK